MHTECVRKAKVVLLKPPAIANSAPRQQRRLLLWRYSTLSLRLVTKSIMTNQATLVNIPSTIRTRENLTAELKNSQTVTCDAGLVKKLTKSNVNF